MLGLERNLTFLHHEGCCLIAIVRQEKYYFSSIHGCGSLENVFYLEIIVLFVRDEKGKFLSKENFYVELIIILLV